MYFWCTKFIIFNLKLFLQKKFTHKKKKVLVIESVTPQMFCTSLSSSFSSQFFLFLGFSSSSMEEKGNL
jgi:hypothetical protein